MEVTRFNFKEARALFLEKLEVASFVSFDLEMTGIRSEMRNETDLPFENFLKAFNAANRYNVIQMGLCIFVQKNAENKMDKEEVDYSFLNSKAEFEAYPFTFYLFPRTYDGLMKRDVAMEVSSIEFNVNRHGINWNKWLDHGIGYCDEEERKFLREFIFSGQSKEEFDWD
jgi:hypothetical protein